MYSDYSYLIRHIIFANFKFLNAAYVAAWPSG